MAKSKLSEPEPRTAKSFTLQVKITPAFRADMELLAAGLDTSVSAVAGEMLRHAWPHFRKQAVERQGRRAGRPIYDIPPDAVSDAVNVICNAFGRKEGEQRVSVDLTDFYGPRGRVMFDLLSQVWGDHPSPEAEKLFRKMAKTANVNPPEFVAGPPIPETPAD